MGFRGGIAPGYGGPVPATVAPVIGTTVVLPAFPQGAYRLHSMACTALGAPVTLICTTLAGNIDVAVAVANSFTNLEGYLAFGTLSVVATVGGGVVALNYDIVTTPRVS